MAGLLLWRAVRPEQLRRQAAPVVADAKLQRSVRQKAGRGGDLAVLNALQTVQDRVFRKRLEQHFRNHERFQLLRNVGVVNEAVGKADTLDLNIAAEDLKLLFQRDEFVRRDAEAQDVRQIRGHQRHLRHLIDLADPLHGVQRVAEKMRV